MTRSSVSKRIMHLNLRIQCECGDRLDAHSSHDGLEFTCPNCRRHYIVKADIKVHKPMYSREPESKLTKEDLREYAKALDAMVDDLSGLPFDV